MTKLDELEYFIERKAKALSKCRYAFSVILPEERFQQLVELSDKPIFFKDESIKYPWCHLKLITETYVRSLGKDLDEKGIRNLLEKVIGHEVSLYWDKIPGIIEKLDLRKVRDEGGPWYIYANVVLHSGIPAAYFDELFDMALEKYTFCGGHIDRTVSVLIDERDIFKYSHFSKYFKEAFDRPAEKKMLFGWLAQLADISRHGAHQSSCLAEHLPPHLLACFDRRRSDAEINGHVGSILRPMREKIFEKGLVFNSERCVIEYRIPAKRMIPVRPDDLATGIAWEECIFQVFENISSPLIDILIFNSTGNLLLPGEKEVLIENEENSLLIFISRKECCHLKEKFDWYHFDDLSGGWWNWYHYEWKVTPFDTIIEFPEPYGRVKVNSIYKESPICGEWVSDVKLPKSVDNIEQYGGDTIPALKIRSASKSKPLIVASYSGGDSVVKERSLYLTNVDDAWLWKGTLDSDLKWERYEIEVKVYHIALGEDVNAIFRCIWYPSLSIRTIPNSMLLPDEQCIVRIKGNRGLLSKIFLDADIENASLSKTEHEYSWIFKEKPTDCTPLISLRVNDYSFDFYVKLPYLSVWIQTNLHREFKPEELEWSNTGAFSLSLLQGLVKRDFNTRVRFRLFSKECKELFLYEHSTNQLIKKLSFDSDGHDSVGLSEILRYDYPFIKDEITGLEAYLVRIEKKEWNFNSIHEKAKRAYLYKRRFYVKDKAIAIKSEVTDVKGYGF